MDAWNLGGIGYVLSIAGILLGLVVIIASVMIYINPMQHELWGALIIVLSVISMFTSMGGLMIGLVLGIIGGILAIMWKPA